MNDEEQQAAGSADEGTRRRLTEEQRRQRVREQVQDIVRSLGGPDVVWWFAEDSDDAADFEYIYARGRILVRDDDVDRVRTALDGGEPVEGLVNGVTSFALPHGLDAPEALARLDERVGVGVGTPDTVMYVTPRRIGGCCPATEPEVVPAGSCPLPDLDRSETATGRGTFVSVVDTGWYDPAKQWAPWLEGVTGDPEIFDPKDIRRYVGHGTFIAGVVRSMAPEAEVRVEGFLPNGGAILESKMVVQLLQALELGPDVISMSAGAATRRQRPLLSFEMFWERHLSQVKGTVLVAAAGNDSTRAPFWPAAFPWSVSVGAIDAHDARAEFSNYGSWVDVYALGVDLVNAFPQGTYVCKEPPSEGQVRKFDGMARWSGTSFSTPLVSGLIAARMSATGESARQAADALLQRALTQAVPGVGPVLRPGDAV